MKTINVTTWHLETILEGLQDSLKVAQDPKIVNEHGYPYCYGYLDASVSNAIFELKALLKKNEV
jgi:hypothetical protein